MKTFAKTFALATVVGSLVVAVGLAFVGLILLYQDAFGSGWVSFASFIGILILLTSIGAGVAAVRAERQSG